MRKSIFRNVQHRLEYGILMTFGAVLRMMPSRAVYAFIRFLGLFTYHVVRIRREVALENLRQALGKELTESELKRVARETYVNIGMTFIEMLLLPRLSRRLFEVVDISEISVLKRAYEQGKGVILISGHFGNWELNGASIGMAGYCPVVVAKRQSNPYVDAWILRYRESMNMRIITPGAPVRHILRALKNGEAVGLISDQDAGSRGVFVNFFGRPASTPRGAAELALKYSPHVIVCLTPRTGRGTYRTLFREIEVLDDDTVESLTQRYTTAMEEIIRQYPEQYFWMHRRWKTLPGNDNEKATKFDASGGEA
ncbi:MAG: lysophospholipid acyltransferase family protein [Candidatus Latescibacterota bacterium]